MARGVQELQDSSAHLSFWKNSLIVSLSPSHTSAGTSEKGQTAGEWRSMKNYA